MASTRSALVVVDVQKDFCAGGALAVRGGDEVVPVLNRHIADATRRGWPVFATRDWHPPDSRHFQIHGGEWPVHCVQQTDGARYHDDLQLPASAIVISTGEDPGSQGYSPFEDGRAADGRTFLEHLRERQIEHLYVGGLATDYCVRHTVLDARRAGLAVTVLGDAIAGVEVQPGDSARALAEMERAGAAIATHLGRDERPHVSR